MKVLLNQLPLPTAQITIFVFKDDQPINNAPDLPEEQGLPGFPIVVEDGGGRYGMSAGVQYLDVFGNMLGEDKLEVISPFRHFDPNYILANGTYDIPLVMISVVIVLISITASYLLYQRRNIPSAA